MNGSAGHLGVKEWIRVAVNKQRPDPCMYGVPSTPYTHPNPTDILRPGDQGTLARMHSRDTGILCTVHARIYSYILPILPNYLYCLYYMVSTGTTETRMGEYTTIPSKLDSYNVIPTIATTC
jgi:hypothetical protein